MRDRYNNNLAFVDLLFNIVVGITFLFLIAFIMIKPPTKQEAVITPKAEYIITMEWPDNVDDDMDLWVAGPTGKVGFARKEDGVMTLERDDRGIARDTIKVGDNVVIAEGNKEVVSIRAKVAGEYFVTGVMYDRANPIAKPIPVRVEVLQLNPYQLLYTQTIIFSEKGESRDYYSFKINEDGKYEGKRETSESAVDTRFAIPWQLNKATNNSLGVTYP